MVLDYDLVRVKLKEPVVLPLIRLPDRRMRAKGDTSWVFVRQCEKLLFNTQHTTGSFAAMLARNASARTTMVCYWKSVADKELEEEELKALLGLYHRYAAEPLAGKARLCTLVPAKVFLQMVAGAGYCPKHCDVSVARRRCHHRRRRAHAARHTRS